MDDMQAIKSLLEEIKLAKGASLISDDDRRAKVDATLARLYRYCNPDMPLFRAQ